MPASRRPLALLVTGALVVAGLLAAPTAAIADTRPAPGVPATVSTDSLPAPQINGVVWTQVVIGNTVYAAGRFSRARKSGESSKAAGVARHNMLAYDIATGQLLPDFAPDFNSEVRSLAVSPDGKTIFAVGNFTAVNGARHTRIAAIDAVTGQNDKFGGSLNSLAYTVAAHGDTVYAGGQFTSASGAKRTRLAAFSDDGALQGWTPTANRAVQAIGVAPSGDSIVVGGHFTTINGHKALGSARVNDGSGKSNLYWGITSVVQNSGPDAAIYSISGNDDYVFLSGYSYHPKNGSLKRLEGIVSATWSGHLHWIEDCKGDTYDSFPDGDVIYTASHSHDCATMGGFHQTSPIRYNHSLAFTIATKGVVKKQTKKQYTNFGGNPAPALLDWYPAWKIGHYTGLMQAVWTVTGNSQYVVYGGEFLAVNGNAQQGLARFAVSSIAPNRDGPRLSGKDWVPTVKALGSGKVKVSWQANFDRDNKYLTTEVLRYQPDGTVAIACTLSTPSRYYWSRPDYSCTDTYTPGAKVTYKLLALDPFNNKALSAPKTVTVK